RCRWIYFASCCHGRRRLYLRNPKSEVARPARTNPKGGRAHGSGWRQQPSFCSLSVSAGGGLLTNLNQRTTNLSAARGINLEIFLKNRSPFCRLKTAAKTKRMP